MLPEWATPRWRHPGEERSASYSSFVSARAQTLPPRATDTAVISFPFHLRNGAAEGAQHGPTSGPAAQPADILGSPPYPTNSIACGGLIALPQSVAGDP